MLEEPKERKEGQAKLNTSSYKQLP